MTDADFAIAICSRCGAGTTPGIELAGYLTPHALREGFRIETIACLAGCERPLAVAFTAPAKASLLFGDVDPVADVATLLSFGQLYRSLPDGWCNESDRPDGLRGKTLARIPFVAGLDR